MPFMVTRQRRKVQLQLFQDTINFKLLLKFQPNSKHFVYKPNALQGHSFERIALNSRLWDFNEFIIETCIYFRKLKTERLFQGNKKQEIKKKLSII